MTYFLMSHDTGESLFSLTCTLRLFPKINTKVLEQMCWYNRSEILQLALRKGSANTCICNVSPLKHVVCDSIITLQWPCH